MAQRKNPERCTYSEVNVQDAKSLKPLIYTCDLVISYIPAFLHIHVAKACLELRKNMVTASYISKEMMELDK
jgi:saccharopine dehydrogenase-like NADP-dependent oxidoreductase